MNPFRLLLILTAVCCLFAVPATFAQQSYALKPYAITLPRVNTTQQQSSSTVPQQAGNLVYNTDQNTVAVHNGSKWNYLGTATTTELDGTFKNAQGFYFGPTQIWSIPAGVEQFLVEAWGGGAGGGIYATNGHCVYSTSTSVKSGGNAGGYIRRLMTVVSGSTSVSVQTGGGGSYGNRAGTLSAGAGGNSVVRYNGQSMTAYGGSIGESTVSGVDNFSQAVNPGSSIIRYGGGAQSLSFTYAQIDASNYVLIIKGSDGGLPYGALRGQGGVGSTFALRNRTTLIFETDTNLDNDHVPGIGGGCGYENGTRGGDGLVIIRW